jgi:hypothetical protein
LSRNKKRGATLRLHSRIYSFEDDIVNSFNYYEVRLDFFSFGTWAVRLISSENNTTYNTVVVNSANAAQGSVSGGGAFVTGTQRTISASPHTGYRSCNGMTESQPTRAPLL